MKALKIILGFIFALMLALPVLAGGHWKKNMLLVYVPEHEYSPMMNKAFKDWEGRLHQKIQFYNSRFSTTAARKDDINLVDIEVKFVEISGGEEVHNSGSTTFNSAQSGNFRHAVIVIELSQDEKFKQDAQAKAKNDEEIYRIMLHEVGRVLGLTSSSNSQSVMYDKIEEGQTILPEDIENIYNLYNWPMYKPLNSKR